MVKLGVIGGGEAYRLLREGAIKGDNLGARETPFGKSQPIFHVKTAGGGEYYFLSRHGIDHFQINSSAVNYRANIYAMKALGVTCILAWSGVGSIAEGFPSGSFAVLEDVIDETRKRPSTFFTHSGIGFLRQNPLFCPRLRKCLKTALDNLKLNVRVGGVYVCTEGPRLDTAAEIRKYQSFGAELVGSTLAPEVFLARELELCYASFAFVTNRAEGTVKRDFVQGKLFEGMVSQEESALVDAAVAKFPAIITELVNVISAAKPEELGECACPSLLDACRKSGILSGDWHEAIAAGLKEEQQRQ